MKMELKPIAIIHTDFPSKFGVPRQSGLTDNLSAVVFLPEYRQSGILKGIGEYDYLWLIWGFHLNPISWSPTVRPPRLGGNATVGVFASRSPFRPNPIGLSSVRLVRVAHSDEYGEYLLVSGADLADGTPIYDVKPYLEFTDAHTDIRSGFAADRLEYHLDVFIPDELLSLIPPDKRSTLYDVLSQDPRPAYQSDPDRIYGFPFLDKEIKFRVTDNSLIVVSIQSNSDQ